MATRPDERRTGLSPEPETVIAHATGEHSSLDAGKGRTEIAVGLAQVAPRLGDVQANLEMHLQVLQEARQLGADVVVFPELSLTGYFLKDLVPEVAVGLDSTMIKTLAEATGGLDVVVGAIIEDRTSQFFNAALYFSDKRLHFVHRKVYLPTYGLFDEGRYLASGERFRTFTPGFGDDRYLAGILICEDMWHPSAPGILARQGADLMFCISSSPGRGVGADAVLGTAASYDAMTRTYAQLYTSFVVYCNRVGYEDGVAFWGGSRVVGPDGKTLIEAPDRSHQLVMAKLDLGAIRRARLANPLLRDERHDVNDAENKRIRRRLPRD
jgi:predicted amidohydrolase